jgi:hypothetical protein
MENLRELNGERIILRITSFPAACGRELQTGKSDYRTL